MKGFTFTRAELLALLVALEGALNGDLADARAVFGTVARVRAAARAVSTIRAALDLEPGPRRVW